MILTSVTVVADRFDRGRLHEEVTNIITDTLQNGMGQEGDGPDGGTEQVEDKVD